MPRAGVLGFPEPYRIFGTFAGLSFWGGGLTLLAAAPGAGKTSWAGRMVLEAAVAGFPAALACYEHTDEELKFRLYKQAMARIGGAHGIVGEEKVQAVLARAANAVLLSVDSREDTARSIEETLLNVYGFPRRGNALVVVDYLQRVPVVGLSGLIDPDRQGGEAAAELRAMSRRHDWAILCPAALEKDSFTLGDELSALMGDERVPYEADRVLLVRQQGAKRSCGCGELVVHTLKDRTGPTRTWHLGFFGERFFIATDDEAYLHETG
ncbi:MAG TPA: DnaB-like helicase C-terminal domain-containing protein [Anaerolineales bacterium]|nr:DnaB-like helicase C-terminal domain-containing protein [Anaerolineales bacterium]